MTCEDEKAAYDRAVVLYQRARLTTSSAEHNLDAAELTYAAGLAAEIACAFTVETGPGFIACEAVAVTAAVAGLEWMVSAQEALDVARACDHEAAQARQAALDAWCDCISET